jgi:hypothetical protein
LVQCLTVGWTTGIRFPVRATAVSRSALGPTQPLSSGCRVDLFPRG